MILLPNICFCDVELNQILHDLQIRESIELAQLRSHQFQNIEYWITLGRFQAYSDSIYIIEHYFDLGYEP